MDLFSLRINLLIVEQSIPDSKDNLFPLILFSSINSLYENMLQEIKKQNINMYSSKYYNRFNMILLFDDEEYMNSIKKNLNKDNLMLFILDCISVSTGSYENAINLDVIEEIIEYKISI